MSKYKWTIFDWYFDQPVDILINSIEILTDTIDIFKISSSKKWYFKILVRTIRFDIGR